MTLSRLAGFILVGLALVGCAPEPPPKPTELLRPTGLVWTRVDSMPFALVAWLRTTEPLLPLRIYLEGDGFAWGSGDSAENDPLALDLAIADQGPNVAYLSRPCQYKLARQLPCDARFWTTDRYAEEVLGSVNRAIDLLKERGASRSVELIGYSGGAGLATLIAARRKDVVAIRTVAGTLDQFAVAPRLQNIPQVHFVGENDRIAPAAAALAWHRAVGAAPCFRIDRIPEVDHSRGWRERWPELLAESVPCR